MKRVRTRSPGPVRWLLLLGLICAGCGSETGGGDEDATAGPDTGTAVDGAVSDGGPDAAPDAEVVESCGFTYAQDFVYPSPAPAPLPGVGEAVRPGPGPDEIAHAEPPPKDLWLMRPATLGRDKDPPDIVMPGYNDTMPLFERAQEWTTERRCYELPHGAAMLTEQEAYAMYRDIATLTTGIGWDDTPGVRKVVGVRGAYPGTFHHHGNLPDRFNDTLVLLWIDDQGVRHVREWPVNTDTGAYDFGVDASSSLRPNRRYFYINGWHSSYNALHIDEIDYFVWDDTNKNGHWDSDRNGWLPPTAAVDHERTGSGHNIHMGSKDAPLGTAAVNVWSAGCQVIPGMANWTEFIYNAWTNEGDRLSYYLVDVRDIDGRVWTPCTPDGTHACPYEVDGFPFVDVGDTSTASERQFDVYSCSSADESGPEVVYLLTVDEVGTLSVAVDDVDGDLLDVDVHLLDADDPSACLDRANISFTHTIGPGRYFVVVDTYVEGGTELTTPYTLTIDFP